MSTEWGVFNDEGCVVPQCWSREDAEAEKLIADPDSEDETLYVAEMCTEHEGEPADTCEDCFADKQECDHCGDEVHTVSTRGWCDGCEEEAAA